MTAKKMEKKKLEIYKKSLLQLKDGLVHDINNIAHGEGVEGGDSRDISGHVQHMADVATDMYDREFNLGIASNEREVLQRIEMALKKIKDQSYGLC